MIRPHECALLLGVVSLVTPAAEAADAEGPLAVIEGMARIGKTDRPAAHVTLHFLDRDTPGGEAVTDAAGRFRWTPPADKGLRAGQGNGPNCWALAQERRAWTWEVANVVNYQPKDFARTQVVEKLLQPAPTRWEGPRLVVECPPLGAVEVLVRGPDGQALKDHVVGVVPAASPLEFRDETTVRFEGRTDGEGRIRMRWFAGMRRLRVVVPGVGFGSTGLFEVIGGRSIAPEMPPLMPFAEVHGQLDPALNRPGTVVSLYEAKAWDFTRAKCDGDGRFTLRNVVPGHRQFRLTRDDRPIPFEQINLPISPGEKVMGVVLHSSKEAPRPAPHPAALPKAGRGKGAEDEIDWVEGIARDREGRALAGAGVAVATSYHGGLRMYEDVRTTTADDEGHFRIRGPVHEVMQPLTVVVHGKGLPPAVAYYPAPGDAGEKRPPLAITLASEGGAAAIAVFQGGKPLPGAWVKLSRGGVVSLYDQTYVGSARWPGRGEIEALFSPTAEAGADGVAHFEGLFPGSYHVVAAKGAGPGAVNFVHWARDQAMVFGENGGLGVAAGREARTAIAVHPQPGEVRFQVLRPDGTPVKDQNVSFAFGMGGPGSTTALKLDGEGIGTYAFSSPGLWSVDVRFRDSEAKTFPVHEEPFYQAEAVVPISPLLGLAGPIRLKGVRRDRGSIRARLIGPDGLPARGTVQIVQFLGEVDFAGTADPRGFVRFADMTAGRYELRGSVDGLKVTAVEPSGPLPDEAALRAMRVVRPRTVEVKSGEDTQVELRTEPVAYLRGTLHPADGHEASEYWVDARLDRRDLNPRWRSEPKTGRFTFGPLPAGPLTLMFHQFKGDEGGEAGTQDVEVVAGAVAEVDLHPQATAPRPGPDGKQVMLGMGGLTEINSAPDKAKGSVLMADGATPAFGAQALLFVPGQAQPVGMGVSDAAGRLTFQGRWISANPEARGQDGQVEAPTAIVRLPGLTGAAIVPAEPGKALQATLPAPIAATGRVTLGGKPVGDRNARLRVVAAHRGRGVLDAALGLEGSAQPDGHFELAGMTPGKYLVQAECDGIWLSATVELAAEEGKAPPEIALNIPEPGDPIALEVVNPDGRPVVGVAIVPVRPEGPLKALWAAGLRTNADGAVTLYGLEAGRHEILIGDDPMRQEVTVPVASGAAARLAVTRVTLKRGDSARPEN